MSQNRTHDYDLVLEFNEQVINDMLWNDRPELLPPYADGDILDIDSVRISIDYEVSFPDEPGTDILNFDTSIPNGVVVTTPFELNITDLDIQPIFRNLNGWGNGTVRIHHPVITYDEMGDRSIGFNFSSIPLDRINVDVAEYHFYHENGTEAEVPLSETQIEELLANLLQYHLQNNVGQMTILQIPLTPNSDPMLPDEFEVRVINNDCAALLVSTCDETVGNPDAFTTSDIPSGANSVLIISNYTLLQHVVCPELRDALSLTGSVDDYFSYSDGSCELISPTSLDHLVDHVLVDHITLQSMRISIEDNSMDVRALLRVRGFGYAASAQLVGRVELTMNSDGTLSLDYHTDVTDVHLLIEPWVYLLVAFGAAILPTIGGIIAIVLPILPTLLDPIANRVARALGISREGTLEVTSEDTLFSEFPLQIDSIILDDLICSGRAIFPPPEPAPSPTLRIESDIETTDTQRTGIEVRTLAGGVEQTKISVSCAHEARYLARATRMKFPITYQWWLSGYALSGEGKITISDSTIRYEIDGNNCVLFLDLGESLTAELCVRAEARDGLFLFAYEDVEVEGSLTLTSFHGVELLGGPSVLEVLSETSAAEVASSSLRMPGRPEEPESPYAAMPGRNRYNEIRAALQAGMGYDIPIENFG